ncbi:hypothetical protein Btru_066651 [Bulinus truncatus]|nr:hypothetical protein Btru_066651 [Bulinus truncatus]
MSYCKEYGKDQVIFATKDELNEPSSAIINLEEDEEDHPPETKRKDKPENTVREERAELHERRLMKPTHAGKCPQEILHWPWRYLYSEPIENKKPS